MKKRAFGGLAAVLGSACALTWSLPAGAQEWLKDKRIGNGAGYEVGDFEVHPGIAAEVGWDSNYLGRSDKTGPALVGTPPQTPVGYLANGGPDNGPIDTGELRITPSIGIGASPSALKADAPVQFSLGASGTYREFFNSALSNQRNMSAAANATLAILPGREWNGSVNATYIRTIQPTIGGNPDDSYNGDTVVGNLDLATQPNLGTLDWHFGYTFTGSFYEQSAGTPYNNFLNSGYTRGRWRFRPRTALLYDGQLSFRNFTDPSGASFTLHSATPVRARIGLEGLVTPRFSVLAMVGYGATLADRLSAADNTTQQYDSIIGTLELRFFPGGPPVAQAPEAKPSLLISSIAVGYNRDFQASYLDDFYGTDRGYLKADYFFAGRFLVTLQGGVGAVEHPKLYFGENFGAASAGKGVQMSSAFTDINADATLFFEYRLLGSLAVNATGTYSENFSNTQLPVAPPGQPNSNERFDLNVRRITAFLGVRWFM